MGEKNLDEKIRNLKNLTNVLSDKFKPLEKKSILPFLKRYNVGEKVEENSIFECSNCGDLLATMQGDRLPQCDICNMNKNPNFWLKRGEKVHFVAKNPNVIFERRSTLIEKVADKVTLFSGNMVFVFLNVIWFATWIAINLSMTPIKPFDPFPFGLLTMIVSLEAIILSIFVLISQNRITERSEVRSELDYKVNVNSEKMITEALAMLSDIKGSVENNSVQMVEKEAKPVRQVKPPKVTY